MGSSAEPREGCQTCIDVYVPEHACDVYVGGLQASSIPLAGETLKNAIPKRSRRYHENWPRLRAGYGCAEGSWMPWSWEEQEGSKALEAATRDLGPWQSTRQVLFCCASTFGPGRKSRTKHTEQASDTIRLHLLRAWQGLQLAFTSKA